MKLIKKLSRKFVGKYKKSFGLFLCPYCLKEVERQLGNGKKANSCGCVRYIENKGNYKHGEEGTRLYNIWRGMKQRCLNLNHKFYKDYGGRGITICTEWLEFIPFRDWALNNGYQEDLEIDRYPNNNGNYEPNNCRWVTHQVNSQNQRTTKLTLEKANYIRELWNTGNYTRKELAEMFNISFQQISRIINNKRWSR